MFQGGDCSVLHWYIFLRSGLVFIFTIVSPRDGVGIVFRIDIMGGSFSLWLRVGWTLEAADWVFPTV